MTTYTTYPPPSPAPGILSTGPSHGFDASPNHQLPPSHQPSQHVAPSWLPHADYHGASPDRLPVLPPLHAGNCSQPYHKPPSNHVPGLPRSVTAPDTLISNPTSQSTFGQLALHGTQSQTYGTLSPSYSSASTPVGYPSLPSTSSAVPGPSMSQVGPHLYGAPVHSHPLPAFGSPCALSHQSLAQSPLPPPLFQDTKIATVAGPRGRRVLPNTTRCGSGPQGLDLTHRGGVIPVKDTSGKYICVQCNKTYLHLKHLKRHHLRHTGERPYQCYLCSETFCRSDILKRHFQKCSVRRGNPTGANHLTHAQAHLKGNSSGCKGNSTSPTSSHHATPYRQYASYGGTAAPGSATAATGSGDDSNNSSRSSSVIRRESSSSEDRRYHAPQAMHDARTSSNDAPHFAMDHHENQAYGTSELGGHDRLSSYARSGSTASNGQNYFGHLDAEANPPYFEHHQAQPQGQNANYGRGSPTVNAYPQNATSGVAQPSWNMGSMFPSQSSDGLMQSYGA